MMIELATTRKSWNIDCDIPLVGAVIGGRNVGYVRSGAGPFFSLEREDGANGEPAWHVWIGRNFYVLVTWEPHKRPPLSAFLLLVALLGWTEGHLWSVPESLGAWGVVAACALTLIAAMRAHRRFGRDDSNTMLG